MLRSTLVGIWMGLLLSSQVAGQEMNLSAQPEGSKIAVPTDSVVTVASRAYGTLPVLGYLLTGKNYRKAWETPVKLPVFHLQHTAFTIDKLGGGKQSLSLYLRDSAGQAWVLRSIEKDARRGFGGLLKLTPFFWFKKHVVSGTYPFGALIAAKLCKKAGIVAPEPTYYYVADDSAFGEYRSMFGRSVCMLERRDPTPDNTPSISTDTLIQHIDRGAAYPILKQELVRARIIDMLLGDWDRHGGNWRWGVLDSLGQKYYYPIPRDRDHAFFSMGGVVPFLFIYSYEPQLSGFKKKSRKLDKLNFKTWDFDKRFLGDVSPEDWLQAVRSIQSSLTDEVIHDAVAALPPELYQRDGAILESKLKSRRDSMEEGVLSYVEYLKAMVKKQK